jgi:hypothetical protein
MKKWLSDKGLEGVIGVTIAVRLTIRPRDDRQQLIALDEEVARQGDSGAGVVPVHGDPALPRAFRWRRMIETGRHATVADLAAEKINPSYVSRVLRLTL